MDFVTIDGEKQPAFIFKPKIWAIAKDHYNCITFENDSGNKRKQVIKY